MGVRLLRQPRVLDLAPAFRIERQAHLPDGTDRLALLAQWSETATLPLSTTRLIAELQQAGYAVVLSSTCPDPAPLVLHSCGGADDGALTVLRRPNIGYDFGSWAVAMRHVGPVLGVDKVLVVNDSLVGPLAPLGEVIADFESTTADVWGMVESRQVTPHLQSYFRGFRYGTLAEPAMRRWWSDVRVIPDKLRLIAEYEYGFTAFLTQEGYSSGCFVHADDVVWGELNPTIQGWQRLLDVGVPFVKRELLRHPELVPDGHRIRETLAERYGIDVTEWW